jgi:hypothetical protein
VKLPLKQGSTHATPAGVLVLRTCVGLAPPCSASVHGSEPGEGMGLPLVLPVEALTCCTYTVKAKQNSFSKMSTDLMTRNAGQ